MDGSFSRIKDPTLVSGFRFLELKERARVMAFFFAELKVAGDRIFFGDLFGVHFMSLVNFSF